MRALVVCPAVLLLAAGTPLGAQQERGQREARIARVLRVAQPAEEKTRLRMTIPQGTFRTTRVTTLTRIEVTVQNAGEVSARNVRVSATSPGGSHYRLYGPSTLAARESAVYTASPYEIITSAKEIETEATCDNCYR